MITTTIITIFTTTTITIITTIIITTIMITLHSLFVDRCTHCLLIGAHNVDMFTSIFTVIMNYGNIDITLLYGNIYNKRPLTSHILLIFYTPIQYALSLSLPLSWDRAGNLAAPQVREKALRSGLTSIGLLIIYSSFHYKTMC